MLDSVRTRADMRVLEEDPLKRYNVPKFWLELELLGLAPFFENFEIREKTERLKPPVESKQQLLFENIVSRSFPLFLRL